MSNKLILVKYASEIFLKGLNRGKFERKLKENIEKKLSGLQFEYVTDQGRGFIKAEDIDAAVERVRKVFGVAEICIVTEVERDITAIKEEALRKVKEANPKTFKIETNRANKKFHLNSLETSREVGGYVLHHFGNGLEVDVKNPECLVNIEIREKAYVFTSKDKIKAVGGLPYGMNG
ncbi:MAG: tRNA 4-thiouridine(8) synthase ThiI, partial [Clostridium sp.]|nr:tRNA 4-thiouridine(8) synthase ThiI [Clostridium sp.]